MSFPKKLIFSLLFATVLPALAGCGVKGDPLPPERPADIGRGRPTYKRATEEIKMQKAPKVHKPSRPQIDDRDEDDDERE